MFLLLLSSFNYFIQLHLALLEQWEHNFRHRIKRTVRHVIKLADFIGHFCPPYFFKLPQTEVLIIFIRFYRHSPRSHMTLHRVHVRTASCATACGGSAETP